MLGSLNPLPFRSGGGPTHASKAYGQIKRSVGEGGSARNDLGIDGLWRRSRAKGLAAASSAPRRALVQAFAHLATDLLPSYERTLGIIPPAGSSEASRRDAVVAALTTRESVAWPFLDSVLKGIDPRFGLELRDGAQSTTTIEGRCFGGLPGSTETPAFGGLGYSRVANYSSDDMLIVQFAVDYTGPTTPGDEVVLQRAARALRGLLPCWKAFAIITSSGFVLDQSPLDITELT